MNAQPTLSSPTSDAGAPPAAMSASTLLNETYALACDMHRRGRYGKAICLFSYLTLRRPESRRFLLGLGASQFMAGQYERAVQTLAFMLLNHPHDAAGLCLYGHALLLTGERAEALDALTLVLQVDGSDSCFARRARRLLQLVEG